MISPETKHYASAVADPGPVVGGGANLIYIFLKNLMKLKKFWSGGGRRAPLRSATEARKNIIVQNGIALYLNCEEPTLCPSSFE